MQGVVKKYCKIYTKKLLPFPTGACKLLLFFNDYSQRLRYRSSGSGILICGNGVAVINRSSSECYSCASFGAVAVVCVDNEQVGIIAELP